MGRTCVGRQIGMIGAPIGAIGGVIPWWDPNEEGLCAWSAYRAIGAASFAASLVDLTGNGRDAVDPGGAATPAWAAGTGWTFDGIADYLVTTFVPQNDQSQSALVQFTNGVGNNDAIFGADNAALRRFHILPDNAGNVRYVNGNIIVVAPNLVAGNLGIAGNQGYRNGVAEGGLIAAWVGASALAVYIGAQNNGAAADFFACRIRAFALYDCVLTAPQMLGIATAMAAL